MHRLAKKFLIETSYASGKYRLAPEFLSLIITFRCCFKCQMCSIWQKIDAMQMSNEDWMKQAENIKRSFPQDTFVEVNGGEPLIRKDLVYPLVKSLRQHFKSVTLNSNAFLIDQGVIDNLVAAELSAIKISFYSLSPTPHNNLRGNSSAHEHAKWAIEQLSKTNVRVEVGLLITKENIDEVPVLVAWLQTLPNVSIIIQPLDESVESAESKDLESNHLLNNLWPEKKQVKVTFDWLRKHMQNIKNAPVNIDAIERYYLNPPDVLRYRCFAGQRSCIIYPNGDVAMCFKGNIVGNVLQQSISDILKSNTSTKERRMIKTCGKYCRVIGCNFSRGIKEIITDRSRRSTD